MKFISALLILFSFQLAQAEISDAEVSCHNLKGEIIYNTYFRIDKNRVQVFENTGGFAFYGQELTARVVRAGLGRPYIECGADLSSSESEVSLVTCATGSQIRFLNKVLPPTRGNCR